MNSYSYQPSPALDLREWLAQQEDALKAQGWKACPMGTIVFLAGVPPGADPGPELSKEQRLVNLKDTLDIIDQQRVLVEEEIQKLEAEIAEEHAGLMAKIAQLETGNIQTHATLAQRRQRLLSLLGVKDHPED